MITPAYSPTATERVLPRLALDFTTGVLDPRVTVTRALNTATRINSSGLVEIVNADLPRFDYNPSTLAPRGLLIEETRSNLILRSEQFDDPAWAKFALGLGVAPVVTANAAVAPDGTTTADRVQFSIPGNTNNSGDISQLTQIPAGSGTAVAGSIWMRSNTGANQTLLLRAGDTFTAVTVTTAWQRFTAAQSTSAGSYAFNVGLRGSITPNVASADIFVWGAQLEAGAFATSYIPTTTTSLTRNADVVTMTGTNFSSWFNASEGAFAAQYSRIAIKRFSRVFAASNVAESDQITLISGAQADGRENGNVQVASVTNYLYPGNTPAAGVVSRFCLSYKSASSAASLNASSVATSATSFSNPAPTQLNIGSIVTSGQYLNGHVQELLYWPQDLTNAEVQTFAKVG